MSAKPENQDSGPTLALVIPTKDKIKHLKKTLPGIVFLGFDEIIVLDSSKGEREQVEQLCKSLGVRYLFANLDRLRARNAGASASTCDWVMICDDDIVIKKLNKSLFKRLATDCDFMYGGWGKDAKSHFAWIFKRSFFLDVLKGYDPHITGGDDLDITLRAKNLGRGRFVFNIGLYESETVGLNIAKDYPNKWIKNKVLYALSWYPLIRMHPFLIKNLLAADYWRLKRITRGESLGRIIYESLIDKAGAIISPIYYVIRRISER